MVYLSQCLIIAAVTAAGELLRFLIPLPVPAGIYGMILMFILLGSGLLKLKQVEAVGDTLARMIPLLLVPAVVGITAVWDDLGAMLVPCLIAVLLLTCLVLAAAGRGAQAVLDRKKRE
jgi:holin-like protein